MARRRGGESFADQALDIGHGLVVGRQGFQKLTTGFKKGALGVEDIKEAEFPLAVAFLGRLKCLVRGGEDVLL